MRGLTLPSRGRVPAGFARFHTPLTSNVRRMQSHRPLAIVASLGVGVFTAWATPSEWFLRAFLIGIGVTLLLGVIAASRAEEPRPLSTGVKAVSFLLIGT